MSTERLRRDVFSGMVSVPFRMKKDIHPTYYTQASATCACGATYTVGSTLPELHVEICAACHPFYTGNDKVLDTAGRVEKFKSRMAAAAAKKPVRKTTTPAPEVPVTTEN